MDKLRIKVVLLSKSAATTQNNKSYRVTRFPDQVITYFNKGAYQTNHYNNYKAISWIKS